MPIVSQAQQRWAYANKNKKTKEGKAAAHFVEAGPAGGSFKKLPAKKKPAKKEHHFGSLAP